jgi:hypothetical protein
MVFYGYLQLLTYRYIPDNWFISLPYIHKPPVKHINILYAVCKTHPAAPNKNILKKTRFYISNNWEHEYDCVDLLPLLAAVCGNIFLIVSTKTGIKKYYISRSGFMNQIMDTDENSDITTRSFREVQIDVAFNQYTFE